MSILSLHRYLLVASIVFSLFLSHWLLIESLLPPVTPVTTYQHRYTYTINASYPPIIGRRVHNLAYACDVQILHLCVLAVYREVRHTWLVWRTMFCEMRNIFLHCDGDFFTDHGVVGAVVVCICHVLAVERGRDGEVVRISVVIS